jgi:hypothetical protein
LRATGDYQSIDCRIDAVPELQFPEYVFQMTFDGGGTDAQFDRDLFVGPGERNETQNSPFRCGHFGHGCRHPLAAAVDSIQEIGGVLGIFFDYVCVALHADYDYPAYWRDSNIGCYCFLRSKLISST